MFSLVAETRVCWKYFDSRKYESVSGVSGPVSRMYPPVLCRNGRERFGAHLLRVAQPHGERAGVDRTGHL